MCGYVHVMHTCVSAMVEVKDSVWESIFFWYVGPGIELGLQAWW